MSKKQKKMNCSSNAAKYDTIQLTYKFFLLLGDEYIFGPGRWELLQAVRTLGSLRQAAISIGMSYRWAWGRIRDVEKALGIPLLVNDVGKSGNTRTKVLSIEGIALLDWYQASLAHLDKEIKKIEFTIPDFLRTKK